VLHYDLTRCIFFSLKDGKGLSGTVSLDVVKLRNSLQVLDLGSNSLSGEIPAQIASLKKLKYLDLCKYTQYHEYDSMMVWSP
jgi:Leucine-rich repeat (LRR) protein